MRASQLYSMRAGLGDIKRLLSATRIQRAISPGFAGQRQVGPRSRRNRVENTAAKAKLLARPAARRLFGWLAVGSFMLLAVGGLMGWAGLRLNASESIPRGVYWLIDKPPARGAYVAVCPPPSALFDEAKRRGYLGVGPCAGGYRQLLKVVAGLAGDVVTVRRAGVSINGQPWPDSAPRTVDGRGRTMPALDGLVAVLGQQEVLLMSEHCATGFDARYFGPIARSAIIGTAIPLLTW